MNPLKEEFEHKTQQAYRRLLIHLTPLLGPGFSRFQSGYVFGVPGMIAKGPLSVQSLEVGRATTSSPYFIIAAYAPNNPEGSAWLNRLIEFAPKSRSYDIIDREKYSVKYQELFFRVYPDEVA